jgi:Family of unknown function (DUF6084)
MSVETPPFVAQTSEPVFTVLGMEAVAGALTPTLRFRLHVAEPEGSEVHTIALTTHIQVEPARRAYDDATRERLEELFGAPDRWSATTQSFPWAKVSALVPGFTGSTTFDIEVPGTYDLEIAAAKYFYALPDGEVPLDFHFNGMVLYAGELDRLQVRPVPWSCTARWRMPVAQFKAAIAACYPGGGWIRLAPDTLDALVRRRAARGHHSFDALVAELLEGSA